MGADGCGWVRVGWSEGEQSGEGVTCTVGRLAHQRKLGFGPNNR